MDRKFILLGGVFFVHCSLAEVGLASSEIGLSDPKSHSLPSDFGIPRVPILESAYSAHGKSELKMAKALGSPKSSSEPDSQGEKLEREVSLSGSLSRSSDGGSLHKNMVEKQNQIDPLKEYFNNLEKENIVKLDFCEFVKLPKENIQSFGNSVRWLCVIADRAATDFKKAIRNGDGCLEEKVEKIFSRLNEVIDSYKEQMSSFSSDEKGYSIEEKFEINGLLETLEATKSDIKFYQQIGEQK